MSVLMWTKYYKTNIKEIDEQHKELIDILNNLHEAMTRGQVRKEIYDIFQRLSDYITNHFATEENLMESYDYPDILEHKSEHEGLTAKTIKLKSDIDNGKMVITSELMDFLMNWLTNHILGTDKKMGKYLQSRGVF